MHTLCLFSVLACLLPVVFGAGSSADWCYHDSKCAFSNWSTIAPTFCSKSRQSPIDIVSANAVGNSNLVAFALTGFDDKTAMTKMKNTGKTVEVEFTTGRLNVSGGGLPADYGALQFHLHWGNLSSVPGSEHTVDGKQFPMELHLVNAKVVHNRNITAIVHDSEGLAVLGFLIEVDSGTTDQPKAWRRLASLLPNITETGEYVNVTDISMNELIAGVDTTSYYRYLGSLTTPNCNEAVVWTVFKDTIKVSQNLINSFSTTVRIGDSSSLHMTNVFRGVQPLNGRQVTTTVTPPSTSKAMTIAATKSLMALGLAALHPILHRG